MTNLMIPIDYVNLLDKYKEWALPTENGRMRKRLSSNMAALSQYYNDFLPYMKGICEYLNQWPLEKLPKELKPLLYLGLMFMEVAVCIELFKDPDVPESLSAEHLQVFSETVEQELMEKQ